MIQKKLFEDTPNEDNSSQIISLSLNDYKYPSLLKSIPDPPKRLYLMGNVDILNRPSIAIVGTRHPSKEGANYAKRITSFYVNQGFVIVSGLARGVDTIVARTAVEYGSPVIGVLPSPLDKVTPPSNRKLVDDIIDTGGAILSELPVGTTTQKFHFIKRNRIISGISLALVVVEIGSGKGTIHQISYAIQQKRPVIIADIPNSNNKEWISKGFPVFK